MSATPGKLLVISGPSGSGKSTIINKLRTHPLVSVSVSVATRTPRAGEVDGTDYHFVTVERFRAQHAAGEFVETNDVFANGNLYGSLRSELDKALQRDGRVYIMEVDVDGAHNIREAGYDGGTYVFIEVPREELEQRLRGRQTDDEAEIARRLGRADDEARRAREHAGTTIIPNHNVDDAVEAILDLVDLAPPSHA